MDVVVCGAQKLFTRGGAEQHQENLVAAFVAAGHRSELVRLPVAWEKGRLFDSPTAWRLSPVDADLVVATNFPSYFVQHPRKVVWLFHQHRGAYDGADSGAGWSDFGLDEVSVELQRGLADWDATALAESRHVFTTSRVVADRLARYTGVVGTPLYHPPPLHDRFRVGPLGDHVLAVHRFEANKRPHLLGRALARTDPAVRGVATGRGELLEEVRAEARGLGVADRVEYPGFVDDERLLDLYASALAVLTAPEDEDYGYITLQAFLAGRPVITATDSGGTLEWVEDGVTGLVTDGSPEDIARAVDRLHRDRDLAARLGRAGRERVVDLSWTSVVDTLLAAGAA